MTRIYDEKQLGKIDLARITLEDHGILTFQICFDFGGSHQCFSGYVLDSWSEERHRRIGTAYGCDVIMQLLNTFKVDTFEEIVGRTAYAIRGDSDYIIGLETPPFDGGKRFMIKEICKEWGLGD